MIPAGRQELKIKNYDEFCLTKFVFVNGCEMNQKIKK